MTTHGDGYPDLLGEHVDPALARVIAALDWRLRGPTAPPALAARLQEILYQRTHRPAPGTTTTPLLSRMEALKAGAAAAGAAWLLSLGHSSSAFADERAWSAEAQTPMTGERLADILRTARAAWMALLAEVGEERMAEPGVDGPWSVQEIVAHLTWYERVIVEGAQRLMRTGRYERSGLQLLSMDERNAVIAAQSRARPLPDVLAESEQVFGQLLAVIEACPEDLLNDPLRLGLPPEVIPWTLVAANSYEHYQQHMDAIRAWLDRQ
jgi:hypothetical protein